jgi:hypothetical protein
MPGTTSYISTVELAAFLRITDTEDDAQLSTAASAASALINRHCGRAGFDLDAAPVARAFTWPPDQWYGPPFLGGARGQVLPLADIGNATGIVLKTDDNDDGTFETTWSAADYRLAPVNAAADSEPWTEIRAIGSKRFPYTADGVQVTARWGWPAVPDAVRQAAFLLGARLFSRRGAPFAVLQTPDVGASYVPRLDPDIDSLLRPYRKLWAVA